MIRFEVIDATFNLRHKNAIKNWIKEIILRKNRVRAQSITYSLPTGMSWTSTASIWDMTILLIS